MKFGFAVALSILSFLPSKGYGASSDSIIYKQELWLLAPFPKNYFQSVKGEICLTKDSIIFKAFKMKHEKYNFNISRNEIIEAKKWGAFIVPNPWFLPTMVKIKKSDGKIIVLVTSKRKKLLSALNVKSP